MKKFISHLNQLTSEQIFTPSLRSAFQTFTHEKTNTTFQVQCWKHCPVEQQPLLFHLLESNMKEIYLDCGWKWETKVKEAEFFADWMRYYVVFTKESNTLAGYAAFRFDEEDKRFVIYLYELQTEASFRGYGIGSHLTRLLEKTAQEHKLSHIMLTCLRKNEQAMNFYKKMNFKLDSTSPSVEFGEDVAEIYYPYEILSKETIEKI